MKLPSAMVRFTDIFKPINKEFKKSFISWKPEIMEHSQLNVKCAGEKKVTF